MNIKQRIVSLVRTFVVNNNKLPNVIHLTISDELDFYDLTANEIGDSLVYLFTQQGVHQSMHSLMGMLIKWNAEETKVEYVETVIGPIMGGLLNVR